MTRSLNEEDIGGNVGNYVWANRIALRRGECCLADRAKIGKVDSAIAHAILRQ
jgi:hypothetical protein